MQEFKFPKAENDLSDLPVYGWLCRKCNVGFLATKKAHRPKSGGGIRISYALTRSSFNLPANCPNCGNNDNVHISKEVKEQILREEQEKKERKIRTIAIIILVAFFVWAILSEYF